MAAATGAAAVDGPSWTALRERVLAVDRTVPVIVAVALVARVLYWRFAIPDYVPISDAGHYYDIARNVAEGRGFSHTFPQLYPHPTAFRPPLYPLALGGLYWLFGVSIGLAQGVNLALSLCSVVLVMLLARQLGLPRVGQTAAGLAMALFPPLIYNDVVILTEPLSIVLLLATALLLAREHLAWGGAAAGLLVLSRTSGQLLLPVFVVWALWQFGWRRSLRFAAAAVVVIAPWSVRNQVQVGTWSLATSNGFNLAAMYGPPARAANGFVDPVFDPYYDDLREVQFHEARWDAELSELGIESLKDDPTAALDVAKKNAGAFFELEPSLNRGAETFDGRNMRVRDALDWLVPPFAVLGTIGLVLLRRRPVAVLLSVTALYFLFASILMIAAPRLRAPIDAIWCLGVGAVAASVASRLSGHATGDR